MTYVCKNFNGGYEFRFTADSDESALYISEFHRGLGDKLYRLDTNGTFANNLYKEVIENVKGN